MCGDNVRFYVDEKIEATTTADDEKDEFLILFCQDFFCVSPGVGQCDASGNKPTKGGMMQTKCACCHYYSDSKLPNDAYLG